MNSGATILTYDSDAFHLLSWLPSQPLVWKRIDWGFPRCVCCHAQMGWNFWVPNPILIIHWAPRTESIWSTCSCLAALKSTYFNFGYFLDFSMESSICFPKWSSFDFLMARYLSLVEMAHHNQKKLHLYLSCAQSTSAKIQKLWRRLSSIIIFWINTFLLDFYLKKR